ncbi:MAG: hypothetical protein ACE5HE_08825 [Phycisphaerae bacterium]
MTGGEIVDMSELAAKMLEWERAKQVLDDLTADISAAVLEIGETQTVGNVRATYNRGRRSYNYYAACELARVPHEQLAPFESVKTDWRAACKALELEAPYVQSDPSVTVKLIER